jgi:hypothetical protein
VFSVGAIGLALFLRGGLPQNHRMAAVFAYVAYVMASTVWSVDPAFTARAAADLGLFVLAVALLCNRLPARRIINVFLNILGLVLIGSLLFTLAMPDRGKMGADAWQPDQVDVWRGLFGEKNGLGGTAMIGLAVSLQAWRLWTANRCSRSPRRRRRCAWCRRARPVRFWGWRGPGWWR